MEKVIFDTNAYRYLVSGKSYDKIEKLISKINALEAKNNIETLISPIVAMELLAHVANKKDPSYEKCLNAIKALYLHSGNDESFDYVATPDMIIAKQFFKHELPKKHESNIAIIQMCYHLAKDSSKKIFKKFQASLKKNNDHVFTSERRFAYDIKAFVNRIDPDAKSWQIFKSDENRRLKFLDYIRSEHFSSVIAMEYLSVPLEILATEGLIQLPTDDEFRTLIRQFIEFFPQPIALQKYVIESLVNSEFNLLQESRSNFLWDIQLMFNVGNHRIANSKLYFVTDDKAMTRAAVANKAEYSILTFKEYMEYLKKD